MELPEFEVNDTIEFVAEFRDFPAPTTPLLPGPLRDPDGVVFKVYNARQELVTEQVLGEAAHVGLGMYRATYTLPAVGTYTLEMTGQVSGSPAVKRNQVKAVWAKKE